LQPDEEAPEWLTCLVKNLRANLSEESMDIPCIFLTDERRCAIHIVRPLVCREYFCVKTTDAAPPDGCGDGAGRTPAK
jgi:Fe-S-cluster containining protein